MKVYQKILFTLSIIYPISCLFLAFFNEKLSILLISTYLTAVIFGFVAFSIILVLYAIWGDL